METQQAQEIKFNKVGVDFVVNEIERNGKVWYTAKAMIPTPKGKYSKYRVDWFYRFPTKLERSSYVDQYVERIEARLKRVHDAKAAKSAARKAAVNPFKVGEMFYDSWGYDQTNIDFYQITEVGKMSVTLKRIGGKAMPSEGGSPMSGQIAAVKDSFYSDDHYRGGEMKRIVQVTMWQGKVGYGIKGQYNDHGYLSKTSETDSHYESWYA